MQNHEDNEPDHYWCHDSFKLKFSSSSDVLKVKISTLIASYFIAEQALTTFPNPSCHREPSRLIIIS